MGRPLFSKKYARTPPALSEPERVLDPLCQKWSPSNRFNPDSDDFFANAQEERVLLPGERQHIPIGGAIAVMSDAGSPILSESTETTESDLESPRTAGADDQEVRMGRVVDGQWGQQLRDSGAEASEWLLGTPATLQAPPFQIPSSADPSSEDGAATGLRRANLARFESTPPALIPPAALLSQTRPTGTTSMQMPTPPLSPPPEQQVIPSVPDVAAGPNRRPSPEDFSSVQAALPLDAPMTPQRNIVRGVSQTMFTPSPPPSVTPRIYSWQSHAIPAIPTSPTRLRGARDGPLTNPLARRSLLRVGTGQAPVLVSNTAN